MAHIKAEIDKLMRARRAVIEALAKEEGAHFGWARAQTDAQEQIVAKEGGAHFGWTGAHALTDAQEQIVATYVLALETSSVADATYQLGPT